MKKLAIIKNVNIGVGDYGQPALWFDTFVSSSATALQVFNWEEAGKLIKEAGVRSVKTLEGKACIVDEGGGLIRYIKMVGI